MKNNLILSTNQAENDIPSIHSESEGVFFGKNAAERWAIANACISHIFSREGDVVDSELVDFHVNGRKVKNYHEFEIYPNFTKFKGPRVIGEQEGGGCRGKVTEFSKGARLRMIQEMASLIEYPNWWQDLTFPDCVLENKTVEERSRFSSAVLARFKRRLESMPIFSKAWGHWRREWVNRKSGCLKGESCPHFHSLIGIPEGLPVSFEVVGQVLAHLWVDCICSEQSITEEWRTKSVKVSTNRKSFRRLENQKMAQVYVSKYVAKVEEGSEDGSRGRYWGKIGDPPKGEPITVRVTKKEAVLIRRLLRKKVGKSKSRILSLLSASLTSGWLLVRADTVKNMMLNVQARIEHGLLEFFGEMKGGVLA
jgi:hypothetical protein